MLISVIIPAFNDGKYIPAVLDSLWQQECELEVIMVAGSTAGNPALASIGSKVRVVSTPAVSRGEMLAGGAAEARGEVLLFLWPGSCLPATALVAIERNFELLPQSVGGNFHLNFESRTWFTRLALFLLKRMRYRGRYYGHSGIFIRADVYKELDGFRPYDILEDYDLVRRMEAYGPTLFLPDTITASTYTFQHRKLRAVLVWPIIHTLFALGVHPNKLAGLWNPGSPR